jgi:ribosomal protein S24E
MDIKIQIDEEQKLLDRKLIQGKVHFSEKAVPSRMSVIEDLAKKLKVDRNLIIVKEIKTVFGSTTADFEAHVYSDLDIKNKLEPKHLLKRNEIKVAKKKEKKVEVPAEEKKEEKPAEAPVEKKKVESPKEEKKVEEKPAEKKEESKSAEEKK